MADTSDVVAALAVVKENAPVGGQLWFAMMVSVADHLEEEFQIPKTQARKMATSALSVIFGE
jgi:hypothetical protein